LKRSGQQQQQQGDDDIEVEGEEEEIGKNQLLLSGRNHTTSIDEDDDEEDGDHAIKSQALGQNSRRAFLRDLRKIIESAEVILHVLDARDPMGTKSNAIEELVLSSAGKKLVYILNKADLVPRAVLVGWLNYLRQYHPTIPFKCNTQTQKGHLGHTSGKISELNHDALLSNQTIGAEELLNLLKNYCRVGHSSSSKGSISVGIVGFPNVGKSSLINSLTRTRAVNVSSVPGYTKQIQEVILDKNIRLLDSPGVVFADGSTSSTILRNCVNVDEMTDLISPIQAILERCPPAYLMQLYSIPRFPPGDCLSFLSLIARSTGKLKRGGIPNIDAAAKGILHDWNNGKIKYYCKPPALPTKAATVEKIRREEASGDTKILTSFSNQINFDDLGEEDIKVLDELSVLDSVSYVGIEKLEYVGGEGEGDAIEQDDDDEEEEDMSDGESKKTSSRSRTNSTATVNSVTSSRRVKKTKSSATSQQQQEETVSAVALRGQQKKSMKKVAKDLRRNTGAVSAVDRSKLEDYSFETDFQYSK
jgi:nuclear GTP-binding protein